MGFPSSNSSGRPLRIWQPLSIPAGFSCLGSYQKLASCLHSSCLLIIINFTAFTRRPAKKKGEGKNNGMKFTIPCSTKAFPYKNWIHWDIYTQSNTHPLQFLLFSTATSINTRLHTQNHFPCCHVIFPLKIRSEYWCNLFPPNIFKDVEIHKRSTIFLYSDPWIPNKVKGRIAPLLTSTFEPIWW